LWEGNCENGGIWAKKTERGETGREAPTPTLRSGVQVRGASDWLARKRRAQVIPDDIMIYTYASTYIDRLFE